MATFNNHQMTKEELLANDYREYRGKEINVYFKAEICQHAAECVRGNLAVLIRSKNLGLTPMQQKQKKLKKLLIVVQATHFSMKGRRSEWNFWKKKIALLQ